MNESMLPYFFPIPEIRISKRPILDYVEKCLRSGYSGHSVFRHHGFYLPYGFVQFINEQIKLDINLYNRGIPVFRYPQIVITDTPDQLYPKHYDLIRECSLNLLIGGSDGDSDTYWESPEGSVRCDYTGDSPILFNTQIPHWQIHKTTNRRILLSVDVGMGFDRFMNLYRDGYIFGTTTSHTVCYDVPKMETVHPDIPFGNP